MLPGSREVTKRLQELGKHVYFVTNSPVKIRSELRAAAVDHGYQIAEDKILSASYVTAKYLHDKKFNKKVYLIGSRGMSQELDQFRIRYIDSDNCKKINPLEVISNGIELDDDVEAVIVSFDQNFNYSKMLMACNYIKNPDCLFIGTNYDEAYPTSNGAVVPTTGAMISAIEVASGRKATIMGKPNPNMCKSLFNDGKLVSNRTVMIGDSGNYDIRFGFNCGFQTLMVGSGINNLDDIQKWKMSNAEDDKKKIPDTYLPKLGDLLEFLE